MKKNMRASVTIEAAVIVPLILFVFVVLMNILFYYHDKNVLIATAHETATLGSSRKDLGERELENYFQTRAKRKVIMFSQLQSEVKVEADRVSVICEGKKNMMQIHIESKVTRTDPVKYIFDVQKIKKIGEKLGEEE